MVIWSAVAFLFCSDIPDSERKNVERVFWKECEPERKQNHFHYCSNKVKTYEIQLNDTLKASDVLKSFKTLSSN